MSKKLVIGIIVFFLIILIAIVLGGSLLFSLINKEKTSLTPNQFKTIANENNYLVNDITSKYSEFSYVENVSLAYNSNYQIEFYDLINEEYAIGFYNNNKSIFENSKDNVNSSSNISGKNYSKYTLDTNGKYKVLSRINDTVIYINVDNIYKDDIKTLLDKIDY